MNILHVDNASRSLNLVESCFEHNFDKTRHNLIQCNDWFDVKRQLNIYKTFDLVFLKLTLPIFDGYAVYQLLYKIYNIPKQNIYFLQGIDDGLGDYRIDRPVIGYPLNLKVIKRLIKKKLNKPKKKKYA